MVINQIQQSILTETLVIKNEVHEVKCLSEFLKSVSQQLDVSTSVANQLRLAVEEAVVNVIDYAYPIGTEGDITIRVLSDGKTVRIQIIDKAQAYDPTAMQRADTTLSAEERNIGGLGILLVREQMDSINYERTDGKNVLTLIKKIK
jgi:anti-sigma regulatory factor (Ser/Thr protein kinase)